MFEIPASGIHVFLTSFYILSGIPLFSSFLYDFVRAFTFCILRVTSPKIVIIAKVETVVYTVQGKADFQKLRRPNILNIKTLKVETQF